MGVKRIVVLALVAGWAACCGAETITGTITIKRRLTHQSVTPPVSLYQRGTEVKLGKDPEQNPIVFELSRVVVYLEGADPSGYRPTTSIVQVAQRNRRFTPDLVVIPAGSAVSFPNLDPIFHNIFSLSKARSFDLGSYDKGETRKVVFPKPGIVDVYCHLHPNMQATVVVTPNRWYAQPDASGNYRIADVPPGTYTVVAWHKSAGYFRKTIQVTAGHGGTAGFFIPVEGESQTASSR